MKSFFQKKILSKHFSVVSLILLLANVCAGAEPESAFAQGKTAFKNKNYQDALQYFTRAKERGEQHPSLLYNIAICHFKLKQYDKAKELFIQLSQQTAWKELVQYNLGLIEQAQGNTAKAREWFTLGINAKNEKLRKLNQQKLAQMNQRKASSKKNRTSMLALTVGTDSNAASLADDLVQSGSAAEDTYTEILGFSQGYLSGTRHDGLSVYGFGFIRQYSEFDSFNSVIASFGLTKEATWGKQHFDAGIRYTHTTVDGNQLTGQLQGQLQLSIPAAQQKLQLAYLPSQYFAGDKYSHLAGSQHRMEAKWTRNASQAKWILRYRYEINDRSDLQRENGFASYSPTRHSIKGEINWKLSEKTRLDLGLERITSEYPDENTNRDLAGELTQQKRDAVKNKFDIALSYTINKNWKIKGEYSNTDNDDTSDLYDFDKQVINAGVELVF